MFENPEANWHSFALCVPPASHSVLLDFVIFLLSFMHEGVRASKVWSHFSSFSNYFFLMLHIHSRCNPVFYLRTLNALIETMWGLAH